MDTSYLTPRRILFLILDRESYFFRSPSFYP
uniref:NADH-plastoquinone oxidoreductase subunit 4 n=1 Tax=Solanum betaceum TaxID=45843 RepID=A0A7T7BBX9_CYPBE|nr:NADH-plastoquinone oxidoreductase subunit 4 [Solanum betaceum]